MTHIKPKYICWSFKVFYEFNNVLDTLEGIILSEILILKFYIFLNIFYVTVLSFRTKSAKSYKLNVNLEVFYF